MKESTMPPKTKSEETAIIEQRLPSGNGEDVATLVKFDIEARVRKGEATYGARLKTNSGRDPLIDAYQEALDLALYLRQHIEELKSLRAKLAEADKWMRHDINCELEITTIMFPGGFITRPLTCTCGLNAFKASLTTLGGKGE